MARSKINVADARKVAKKLAKKAWLEKSLARKKPG
jgi:hypothetical protein